ncbi:MAG: ribonuclease P protein component [Erysipelotrichaceae bacterium]|nr:ribonuclease P protein component [Erysipelotrichaceae bacterium]
MNKRYRLKKSQDFAAIIKKRHSVVNKDFVLYYDKQELTNARVGISVSKKLGKAVVRNKIKRQVRMIVSQTIDLEESYDFVVIVRQHFTRQTYLENEQSFAKLYKQFLKKRG